MTSPARPRLLRSTTTASGALFGPYISLKASEGSTMRKTVSIKPVETMVDSFRSPGALL